MCIFTNIYNNSLFLLCSKQSSLEVYLLSPRGLLPLHEITVFGRICALHKLRFANEKTDSLLFITQKFQISLISWNQERKTVIYPAVGSLFEPIGKSIPMCLSAVDPLNRVIIAHAFTRLLKVIPINENGTFEEMFTVSLDGGTVQSLCFLYSSEYPTFCVLYKDGNMSYIMVCLLLPT